MPVITCQEGMLLIANAAEALRRQCELPSQTASKLKIALEMDAEEAIKAANRHVADHMMHCPICRAG